MFDYGLSRGQLEEGWVDMLAWASTSHPLSFPPCIYGITPLILLQTSPLTPGADYSSNLPQCAASHFFVFAHFMLTISAVTPNSYCLLDGKSINGGQGQLIPRSLTCSRKEIIANLQSDRCISVLIGVIWPKHLLPLSHKDAIHRIPYFCCHMFILICHLHIYVS